MSNSNDTVELDDTMFELLDNIFEKDLEEIEQTQD